jgi:hypothetical protein
MSVVAAYHIFLCALFVVQGGMWTGYREVRGMAIGRYVDWL